MADNLTDSFNHTQNNSTKVLVKNDADSHFTLTVVLCAVNFPICVTTLLGNTVVLIAIWRTSSLHSPAYVLLASLAMSDLAVGAIAQPLYFSFKLSRIAGFPSFYGIGQTVYNVVAYCLCGVSFFMVTAVGVDRLIALEFHLRYVVLVTQFRAGLVISAIWSLSALVASMWLWAENLFHGALAALIVVCLCVSFFVYWKIFRIVLRHQAQINAQEQGNDETYLSSARLRKSAMNTFSIYIVFLLCYIPYLSALIASLMNSGTSLGFNITSILVYLNSTLNPLVYCWRLSDLRRAVKQIIDKLCCKQPF